MLRFAHLHDTLMDRLIRQAAAGILVSDVIADAFTREGERPCQRLGLKLFIDMRHCSRIYEGALLPPSFMPTRTVRSLSRELSELLSQTRPPL